MLIRFVVANFKSFRDPTEISLEPSREKTQRSLHVHDSSIASILRMGLIYGTNSSGKSNLFKAIEYAKSLITEGRPARRPLLCPKFRLDSASRENPTSFLFIFSNADSIFTYKFLIGQEDILSEELLERKENEREKLLYKRTKDNVGNTKFSFGSFKKKLSKDSRQLLQFVSSGTRPNQLFLHESIERNLDLFQTAYDWFDKSIRIFTPQSISHGVEFRIGSDIKFTEFLTENLKDFDPSVVDIETTRADIATVSDIPPLILSEMKEKLDISSAALIADPRTGKRFVIVRREDGDLEALIIQAKHKRTDSKETVSFELDEESDGTRRFLELAPLIYELMHSEDTVVAFIDELDRSFHSGLTQQLLSKFLIQGCKSRTQIIATTHDSNLLDNDRLKRRDIIWMLDKEDGVSKLTSMKEFNLRHDLDIRKRYMKGEYGGAFKIDTKFL